MSRVMSRVSAFSVAALVCLFLAGPVAAQVGFTVSHEADSIARLYRLNLETANYAEVGNLGSALSFSALDRGPDGLFYGLTWSDELYTVDASGATELIGELETADLRGLAFDPGGDLWAAGGQSLERLDTATGATLESLALDQDVKTLAATGDQLFGISEPNRKLWAIDTGSGELTHVADLPGIYLDWTDADFDQLGTLWIIGGGSGPIMGTAISAIFNVPDPSSGEVIELHSWLFNLGEEDPRFFFGGVAMAEQSGTVVDVPALGGAGAALLAALLAGLGASAARRSGRGR